MKITLFTPKLPPLVSLPGPVVLEKMLRDAGQPIHGAIIFKSHLSDSSGDLKTLHVSLYHTPETIYIYIYIYI